MTKPKKKVNKEVAKSAVEFSPVMADRMWSIVKDVAANRAKELEHDRSKTERIFVLAESAKREFIMKNFPQLMDNGSIVADDVMAVLTTMTIMIANEIFESNPEVMEYVRANKDTHMKPHSHKDGMPLYV